MNERENNIVSQDMEEDSFGIMSTDRSWLEIGNEQSGQ